MSATTETGYIYRVPQASAEQLQTIVATYVREGWTFGGAAQWDFDSQLGRKNLRDIEKISAAPVNVAGDFGHAFNETIEIRWKRCDDDAYDVLILSETPQSIAGATPLLIAPGVQWRIRRYAEAALIQTGDHPAIGYIDYLAPNGAVQFQRYKKVK